MIPDIINYLLTLRYPNTGASERGGFVCYRGILGVIVPLVPPGTTLKFTISPLHGVFSWVGWSSRPGTDVVPNAFTGSVVQYGSTPWTGVVTERGRSDPAEYLVFITDQEPAYASVTNISPLGQRWETIFDFLVIPSSQDLETVFEALRRYNNTTKESEELLEKINSHLGTLAGQPQAPLPPVGGSL